jgi:hypothetical protein
MKHNLKFILRSLPALLCGFLLTCHQQEPVPNQGKTIEKKSSTDNTPRFSKGVLETHQIQFLPSSHESSSARIGISKPCMIDGVFWDVCPIVGGDVEGSGGGPVTNPQNVPPDFNPLSGSITVAPNPAEIGGTLSFSLVIENEGGLYFPPGSLRPLANLGVIGVHVYFYLLSPQHPQISQANLVYTGVFDPGHPLTPVSYGISGSFQIGSSVATAGANHQFAVVVDPNHYVPELNENNNTSYDRDILEMLAGRPDLEPLNQPGAFTLTPEIIGSGQTVTVGCKVKNSGGDLQGPVSFNIKYIAVPESGDELASPFDLATFTKAIPAGQSMATSESTPILRKTVVINLLPGKYTIKAITDSDQQIQESNGAGEMNNVVSLGTLTVGAAGTAPDLMDPTIVRAFSPHEVKPGDPISIEMDVKNNGTLSAASFTIKFYCSKDVTITTSDFFLAAFQVDGAPMNPGEIRHVLVGGQVPANVPVGDYHVGWIIDADNSVTELNENNNIVVASSSLLTVRGADLVFAGNAGMDPIPSHGGVIRQVPGKKLLLGEVTIKNQGVVSAPGFTVNVYLSSDTTVNEDDILFATKTISSLSAGALTKFDIEQIMPTTTPFGMYFILYAIDPPTPGNPQGKIPEGKLGENNNNGVFFDGAFFLKLKVVSACDLINDGVAASLFTRAVKVQLGTFCTLATSDPEFTIEGPDALISDFIFFGEASSRWNGKYCSGEFDQYYDQYYDAVLALIPDIKQGCPEGALTIDLNTLPVVLKFKILTLASNFMSGFKDLRASCSGVIESVPIRRVYCDCPDTNFLRWLPTGPYPGDLTCGVPPYY